MFGCRGRDGSVLESDDFCLVARALIDSSRQPTGTAPYLCCLESGATQGMGFGSFDDEIALRLEFRSLNAWR